MDEFDSLLDQAQRLATSGRAIQWRRTLQQALALERTEPPSLRRAEALFRHGAGVVPEGALLETHLRAVTIAWELGDTAMARSWTEHLVNVALAAGRPEAALPAVRQIQSWPSLSEANRRQVLGWERTLVRATTRTEAPPASPRKTGTSAGTRPPDPARQPVRALQKHRILACGIRYLTVGWTGWVPTPCRNTLLALPVNRVGWLWGWPRRFGARMASVHTRVILLGPMAGGWTSGVDTDELAATLPRDLDGWVWTNRIEKVSP